MRRDWSPMKRMKCTQVKRGNGRYKKEKGRGRKKKWVELGEGKSRSLALVLALSGIETIFALPKRSARHARWLDTEKWSCSSEMSLHWKVPRLSDNKEQVDELQRMFLNNICALGGKGVGVNLNYLGLTFYHAFYMTPALYTSETLTVHHANCQWFAHYLRDQWNGVVQWLEVRARKTWQNRFWILGQSCLGEGTRCWCMATGQPSICVLPALNYFVGTLEDCDNELAGSYLPL